MEYSEQKEKEKNGVISSRNMNATIKYLKKIHPLDTWFHNHNKRINPSTIKEVRIDFKQMGRNNKIPIINNIITKRKRDVILFTLTHIVRTHH